jgi:hypothetical protein
MTRLWQAGDLVTYSRDHRVAYNKAAAGDSPRRRVAHRLRRDVDNQLQLSVASCATLSQVSTNDQQLAASGTFGNG